MGTACSGPNIQPWGLYPQKEDFPSMAHWENSPGQAQVQGKACSVRGTSPAKGACMQRAGTRSLPGAVQGETLLKPSELTEIYQWQIANGLVCEGRSCGDCFHKDAEGAVVNTAFCP